MDFSSIKIQIDMLKIGEKTSPNRSTIYFVNITDKLPVGEPLKGPPNLGALLSKNAIVMFSIYDEVQNISTFPPYKASLDVFNSRGSDPGFGRYCLCTLFKYLNDNGLIKPTDIVFVIADSDIPPPKRTSGTGTTLFDYYQKLGFRRIRGAQLTASFGDLLTNCNKRSFGKRRKYRKSRRRSRRKSHRKSHRKSRRKSHRKLCRRFGTNPLTLKDKHDPSTYKQIRPDPFPGTWCAAMVVNGIPINSCSNPVCKALIVTFPGDATEVVLHFCEIHNLVNIPFNCNVVNLNPFGNNIC
jgi:hypothetical protein